MITVKNGFPFFSLGFNRPPLPGLVSFGKIVLAFFFDFNLWGPTNATLVINNASDSVGGGGGDTMTDDLTAGNHAISYSGISVVAGKSYTFEVTLAQGTWPQAYLGLFDGAVHSAFIDLSTGVITSPAGVISVTSSNAGLLNGYWKFTMKWIANATGALNVGVYQADTGSVSYPGTAARTIKIHTATVSTP